MGPPRAKEASTEVVRPRIEVHKERSEETEIEQQFNHTFLSIKTVPLTIVLQNQTLPFCSYKGLALQDYKAPELATVPCLDTET